MSYEVTLGQANVSSYKCENMITKYLTIHQASPVVFDIN